MTVEPTGLPLIITRPQPDAATSAAKAVAMGMDAVAMPLFAARPIAWQCPDAGDFDALLLTSAHAARLAGPDLGRLRGLPCFAVGAATARAAGEAGLNVAMAGTGGAQALIDQMMAAGFCRLLWLCAADHMVLAVPGAHLTTLPCYRADPVTPPAAWHRAVRQPAVLAVYSARVAAHLATLVGDERRHLHLAVIGSRAAAAAGHGWAAIAVADAPNDAALLSKARLLCHKAGKRVDDA